MEQDLVKTSTIKLQKKSNHLVAHIDKDGNEQLLSTHLFNVAKLAKSMASVFRLDEEAYIAGLVHDMGKTSKRFQLHVRGADIQVDHSTYGMQILLKHGQFELAIVVAGHHAGLPDVGNQFDTEDMGTVHGRNKREVEDDCFILEGITIPDIEYTYTNVYDVAFRIRMIFSCIVDADYIDTETFIQGKKPRGEYDSLEKLLDIVKIKSEEYFNNPNQTELNITRNKVLKACIDKGKSENRGWFTLTVPTGGGKTFSSLAFALEHAIRNHMDRVIYVIPHTSIIDQTDDFYTNLLGNQNVLAHYSTVDYATKHIDDLTEEDYRHILASENWDMPIIITTAEQFYESLYSNKPSKCRKLHNISNSVIIFDEVQTTPLEYLTPCLYAINKLVEDYKSTAVLCTATQPFPERIFNKIGLNIKSKEIYENPQELYNKLKRTNIKYIKTQTEQELINRLKNERQTLCVVNLRATAQSIYPKLPSEGSYCLTTLLCPAGRKKQLEEIKERLDNGLPCRVVSTSLIEAGVDIDFPTAYREETGLDSILQTAGRCNREGRLNPDDCITYVFTLDNVNIPQPMRIKTNAFHYVLREFPDNFQSTEAIYEYFDYLYAYMNPERFDEHKIIDITENGYQGCMLPFHLIDERFKLIQSPQKTVYVPLGEGRTLCQTLEDPDKITKTLYRKLGMYAVNIYQKDYDKLLYNGAIKKIEDSSVLTDMSYYDEHIGLNIKLLE